MPIALTLSGSDPSGGAGQQADLKTFHQHGVYGASVVTLITVQNTRRVTRVQPLSGTLVAEQLEAVLADLPPDALKTGSLGSAAVIRAIAARAARGLPGPLVVDPVMRSKHGDALLDAAAGNALRDELLPLADLVTPNIAEAVALTGGSIESVADMEAAARAMAGMGARRVLVKGGRLSADACDVLLADGELHRFRAERIDTTRLHGTGCVYSAAITARLARGEPFETAVAGAKAYITQAIRTAPDIGGGIGPINMHAPVDG